MDRGSSDWWYHQGLGEGAVLGIKIADAVARFNAMTPEEQRAERERQRRSWVVGEIMLSHPEMARTDAERLYDKVVGVR